MKRYLLMMPILAIALFACKKSESTQPTPATPQYSINQGDNWLFERLKDNITDTAKFIAQAPTTINNIKFYPIFDTVSNKIFIYLNASDSIISAYPFPYGNQTYYVISRIIRANVNIGDSWIDSTVIKPDTIRIKVESKVDSTNVSIDVPAGTFVATKVDQIYKYIHLGITPPEGSPIMKISWYINKDVLFPRIKQNITYPSAQNYDYKLIKYQRAQ